jgi:hypothetical protein
MRNLQPQTHTSQAFSLPPPPSLSLTSEAFSLFPPLLLSQALTERTNSQTLPATVQILPTLLRDSQSKGSGFVFAHREGADGTLEALIVTNSHVAGMIVTNSHVAGVTCIFIHHVLSKP